MTTGKSGANHDEFWPESGGCLGTDGVTLLFLLLSIPAPCPPSGRTSAASIANATKCWLARVRPSGKIWNGYQAPALILRRLVSNAGWQCNNPMVQAVLLRRPKNHLGEHGRSSYNLISRDRAGYIGQRVSVVECGCFRRFFHLDCSL